MADIAASFQPECPVKTADLARDGVRASGAAGSSAQTAWTLLDEATDELVRAAAIIELLASEREASSHQLYAAQIAGDFLRASNELVARAQEAVRPHRPRNEGPGLALGQLKAPLQPADA